MKTTVIMYCPSCDYETEHEPVPWTNCPNDVRCTVCGSVH